MRFLFLGDIAIDQSYTDVTLDSPITKLGVNHVLANLEGPIIVHPDKHKSIQNQDHGVFNVPEVYELLQEFGVTVVSLANNHIFDFGSSIHNTEQFLTKINISSFGAGHNLGTAHQPAVFNNKDTTVRVFAFGWDVIGCRYASTISEGVNPLKPDHVFQTVEGLRKQDKDSCIIFIFHWNYELEMYPQPAHRQLAYDLIDSGVDAIIGLHPHVAQGAEIYKGKPIVYGLGNWFFPARQIGSLKLAFPPISSRQLALELTVNDREVIPKFHWYQFDQSNNQISYESTESIEGSIVYELTPFAGLSHNEYIQWFQKHRKRRRGLPIYYNYKHKKRNWIKDQQVKIRQYLITLMLRLGVKRSLSSSKTAQNKTGEL